METNAKQPRRRASPAWLLFFLAPAVGELLTSAAPPAKFFNPFYFLVVCILYGGGAVMVRELTCRWRKGWAAVLLLGAAFAVVEEGLMMKSFFDPAWGGLGPYGAYGRWMGVNWVWSLALTISHAIVSIGVPVLLVHLLFPARRNEPWVGRWTFRLLAILFTADVMFGALALTRYRVPSSLYLSAMGVAAGFYLLARISPGASMESLPVTTVTPRHPFWFALVGFVNTLGLFLLPFLLPARGIHSLLVMLAIVLLTTGASTVLVMLCGRVSATLPKQQLGLAAGVLSFYILLAPIWEFVAAHRGNMQGMTVVAILASLFLAGVAWSLKKSALPSELTN